MWPLSGSLQMGDRTWHRVARRFCFHTRALLKISKQSLATSTDAAKMSLVYYNDVHSRNYPCVVLSAADYARVGQSALTLEPAIRTSSRGNRDQGPRGPLRCAGSDKKSPQAGVSRVCGNSAF